ncbi:MAG: asparagine synthase (glutamine-hydrolyzing) [Myxococcales bacterium]|nr:asparagine synthase (glutamine-hydrolyzing) [Myxococcales bacterium]
MCGIGGVVGRLFGTEAEAVGSRMAAALGHRGPDRQSVDLLPEQMGLLAHTRLRVIDLSESADQPLWSDDRQIALVFNGEIYNFQELRNELADRGHVFRTRSDTEVILRVYEQGGRAALTRLDGMFAFALYDSRERRLLLMRDRVGKKPLVYTVLPGGGIAFASEIKALAAVPGFVVQPDFRRLPELLTYGYVATPNSFVEGVKRVEPGHQLIWTEGRIESVRYWSLPQAGLPPLTTSFQEAATLVRDSIGQAVKRRMVADVPMGAFLSGGVDSSVVVAEMVRASASPVRTFAAGFPDDSSFDETPMARAVAKQLGLDHRELSVRVSPTEVLERLLWHHDEPYGDSSAVALYSLSKLTREHVTVVLSGDGGDELFGGYSRFLGGLWVGRFPALVTSVLDRALRAVPPLSGYKNPVELARRFTEHGQRPADEQLLAWNAYFMGSHLGSLLKPDILQNAESFDPWSVMTPQAGLLSDAKAQGSDRLDQILRHNFQTYLLDDLLVKADRSTMAFGLEARSPFLDTALVELAFRLPSSFKIRGTVQKWILKKAYEDMFPKRFLYRKKHGFGVPVSTWWRSAEGYTLLQDLLLSPNAVCHQVLKSRTLARLVQEHRAKVRDHGQRLFLLLQLEMWLRNKPAVVTQAS